MGKLYDIKGYWNYDTDLDHDNLNMWQGKIILYEDNWFEGLVYDSNSFDTEEKLVLGIYYPDKFIDLYKFSFIKDYAPASFSGKKGTNGYVGGLEVTVSKGKVAHGFCHIVTQCSELVRNNVSLEISELTDSIYKYVNFKLTREEVFYYEAIAGHRDFLCDFYRRQNDDSKNI